MKRMLVTSACISAMLSGCSSVNSLQPFNQRQAALMLQQNHIFHPSEQVIGIALPHITSWKRIDLSYNTVGTPFMYVPIGENRKVWTQSIRTQIRDYLRYPHINANRFFYDEMNYQKAYCASVTGNIIVQRSDYDLYQMTLSDCHNQPNQQQYGKIFNGKDAVYVVYYSWLSTVTPSLATQQAIAGATLGPK